MKSCHAPIGTAILLVLLCAACESTNDRIQEKSAVYAALSPAEKRQIENSTVAKGFTPDMVYMALGNAAKVGQANTPDGPSELWTYKNYYPGGGSGHPWYAPFSAETSPFQPARFMADGHTPMGMGSTKNSISTTGPPQGGSMEPPDLPSYTLMILFQNGKVVQVGLKSF
jgi:hypothetical protein